VDIFRKKGGGVVRPSRLRNPESGKKGEDTGEKEKNGERIKLKGPATLGTERIQRGRGLWSSMPGILSAKKGGDFQRGRKRTTRENLQQKELLKVKKRQGWRRPL